MHQVQWKKINTGDRNVSVRLQLSFQNKEKCLVPRMQKILTRFTTISFSFIRFTRINICAAKVLLIASFLWLHQASQISSPSVSISFRRS